MSKCEAEHIHSFPSGSETLKCIFHKGHRGSHLVYIGGLPYFFEQNYSKPVKKMNLDNDNGKGW